MGEISLRRRFEPVAGVEVYEVKLDEEFLMSSLFPVAEIALADLALARVRGEDLSVVVGGLGLGYTAAAALKDPRVGELTVVEYTKAVIDWHREGLIPDTAGLAEDERVDLVCDDFFARIGDSGTDPVDVVLLDIDHSPRHVLHRPHTAFYTVEGLRALSRQLSEGGVFAMWSDDPPEEEFSALLREVFCDVEAQRVWFDNPFTGGRSSNTVYLASRR
ncbi:spermidine synthase [Salininema proteolyticum]|uniref:Spermidine synthase n=2 Tax=Salininema proteolyticum TaxID=1607685 RepID=A0ABV8U406_9ACTN